jgi:hypothetical protein
MDETVWNHAVYSKNRERLLNEWSGLRPSDGSPRAESGELFMRREVFASMDLVATIGHLSGALQRVRRRASTSCYLADRDVSPRLQGQLGIHHNNGKVPT